MVARLAVVVTAYARAGFVDRAIRSVLDCRIPSTELQTYLVTNVPVLSLHADASQVRILRPSPEQTTLGSWIAAAVRQVDAEIVTFLDDDDEYTPDRLTMLRNVFGDSPHCGYYHNAILAPEASGGSARSHGSSGEQPPPLLLNQGRRTRSSIEVAWKAGAAFNHSCIAVRRGFLEPLLPELEHLSGGYSAFLFYAALASNWDLLLDPRPFTRYHIHAANESPLASGGGRVWWERSLRLAESRRADAQRIIAYVSRSRPGLHTRPVNRVRLRSELLIELGRPRPRRATLARLLGGLIADQRAEEAWHDRGLLLRAGACLLAPEYFSPARLSAPTLAPVFGVDGSS